MSNAAAPAQRTFLGHPLGLYVLFFAEMWERFSYYGMRALLILYLINYFKWAQKDASTVYKVYTSLVYVTPILGGWLADRYLGNRLAVIIGATLMAIGQFALVFEDRWIFYGALTFLIVGNGFFKPNMSTQVGRLYPTNDGRLDAAYTIFYMGINLGAFLAPLVCGWLAENTVGGYHSGFVAAGLGMLLGLLTYLLGQPLIREIPATSELPAGQAASDNASHTNPSAPLTEMQAAGQPSVLGPLSGLIAPVLFLLGAAMIVGGGILWYLQRMDFWDALMLVIGGGCTGIVGLVAREVQGGVRDRVLTILIMGVFVMFFWAAYEQAGNVLNLWADKHTERHLLQGHVPPSIYPEVSEPSGEKEGPSTSLWERYTTLFQLKSSPGRIQQTWGEWLMQSLNPVPTAWFQSINALAIFVLAPLFAWMWLWLDRRGWQPSIPLKMFFGLTLMSASVAVMIQAARVEDRTTYVAFETQVPPGLVLLDQGRLAAASDKSATPFHAGRLRIEEDKLVVQGVLPDNERDRILIATTPPAFRQQIEQLAEQSKQIGKDKPRVDLVITPPAGFDMRFAGIPRSVVRFDEKTSTLTALAPLQEREINGLLIAGSAADFRATLNALFVVSASSRVSWEWLFWSYILATLGELCLSPVGLAMVSKLAPARFATMLMGVWLLTSAFGNFAAGALGEIWGTIAPVDFFYYTTLVVGGAALVLLVSVGLLRRMMHGVM